MCVLVNLVDRAERPLVWLAVSPNLGVNFARVFDDKRLNQITELVKAGL